MKTALWTTLKSIVCLTVFLVGCKLISYLLKRQLASAHARREIDRRRKLIEESERRSKQAREAKGQKAEAEEQKLRQAQRQEAKEEKALRGCFDSWQADAPMSLANIGAMTRFSKPQMDRCEGCRTQAHQRGINSGLRICQHNMEKLLRISGTYKQTLREERIRFHPDKFHQVAEPLKREIISKATGMFQMLDDLHKAVASG